MTTQISHEDDQEIPQLLNKVAYQILCENHEDKINKMQGSILSRTRRIQKMQRSLNNLNKALIAEIVEYAKTKTSQPA